MSFSKYVFKILHSPISFRIRVYPSLNRILFRWHGVRYGKNLKVFNKIFLNNKGDIIIGDNFLFISGDGINPISSNLKGSIYVEKTGRVEIGNTVGMSSTRIWISNSLTIGNHVRIGACCLIIDTDTHQLDYRIRKYNPKTPKEAEWRRKSIKTAPIIIEDDVWIGAHCIILKGVTIGARSIIGAGSVVTKDIPADCIAAGNPCRVIRFLKNEESC